MTMQSQDIFKAFGTNWKWASLTVAGTARIHTERPTINDGVVFYNASDLATSRCEAFDSNVPCAEQIWCRTDFSNGPQYPTDRFGIPYPAPVAQVPMVPPALQTRLTTDEAENGKLWDFAKVHENYVLVDVLGGVHFSSAVVGVPRYAFDVVVDGVTHSIERTRSQPQLAPPEAGKPFAERVPEFNVAYPAPGLRVDGLEPDEGKYDEGDTPDRTYSEAQFANLGAKIQEVENALSKAKDHARLLLNSYDQHGEAELALSIYLAIFGEQPK